MEAVLAPTTFQYELLSSTVWTELIELVDQHSIFNLDRLEYESAEATGNARLYTIREGEKMIGYAAYFIRGSLWYLTQIDAICHSIYLTPAFRKGWLGVKFIRFCEQDLMKNFSIDMFHMTMYAGNRNLLEALGYTRMPIEKFEKKVTHA